MQPHPSTTFASLHHDAADYIAIDQRAALFANYLSPAELAQVRQRMLDHAGAWHELIAEATRQMRSGVAPHDAAVQEVARRWAALFRASFAGDDAALDGKVREAFGREPGLSAHIDSTVTSFMQRALMHMHQACASISALTDDSPKPSARTTATLRAAHQLLDAPLILDDPLALAILGPAQAADLRAHPQRHRNPIADAMRTTMAVRSRLAEDNWRDAQHHGVRQYVILGAGLDTYAYRADAGAIDAALFEVDLPATQHWKRACLKTAGIAEPAHLRYVAVDFAATTLEQGLTAAGFATGLPATFSWLGVSMYLEADDVMQTLRYVAACAPGSSIVFDYLVAPELLTPIERSGIEMMAASLAAQGEPLRSRFDPATLASALRQLGFRHVEQHDAAALSARYLAGRNDGLRLGNAFNMIKASV